jgi:hypothetical protein
MHLDDTANAEMMLQNYIESLEEENDELCDELKAAITDKRAAVRKSEKDRKLAKSRLDEWDAERLLHREFEDRAAEQEKANQAMKDVLRTKRCCWRRKARTRSFLPRWKKGSMQMKPITARY